MIASTKAATNSRCAFPAIGEWGMDLRGNFDATTSVPSATRGKNVRSFVSKLAVSQAENA